MSKETEQQIMERYRAGKLKFLEAMRQAAEKAKQSEEETEKKDE